MNEKTRGLKIERKEELKTVLVSSSILEYENKKNPFYYRKIQIQNYISLADFYQKLNSSIKDRAKILEKQRIDAIDALHLASAEQANVSYFLTCDYAIIKRYNGGLIVLNPVEFILRFFK